MAKRTDEGRGSKLRTHTVARRNPYSLGQRATELEAAFEQVARVIIAFDSEDEPGMQEDASCVVCEK